ncbi:MAG: hypothetical protein O6947_01005 [Acidobacteria bacterium]|nr:hypothetical protein [Acidobacteriota bacterium]
MMEGTATETAAAGEMAPATRALLSRILDPEAPLQLRMTAARGVLPLPPAILLKVLISLLQDREGSVVEEAVQSLKEFESDLSRLSEILVDRSTDPEVLDYFGRHAAGEGRVEILCMVVENPGTPEKTMAELSSKAADEVLEKIFLNESRLSENPDLLVALKSNPNLSPRQSKRIEEISVHLVRTVTPEPVVPPAPAVSVASEAEPETIVAEEPLPVETETLPQDLVRAQAEEEDREEEFQDDSGPALDRIQRMSVPEKLQLALVGDREERMILIRDSSKMVASTALKSPKMTDKDIATVAALRNVDVEILRGISRIKKWLKNYAVAHALVENPKTPGGIAITLLSRLQTKDLKILAGNRNVPEVVRRGAKRIYTARTQPPKKLRGKH